MSTSSLSNDTTTSVVMDNTRTITEIYEARKGAISPESENQGASSNPVQVHLKKDNSHLPYSLNGDPH